LKGRATHSEFARDCDRCEWGRTCEIAHALWRDCAKLCGAGSNARRTFLNIRHELHAPVLRGRVHFLCSLKSQVDSCRFAPVEMNSREHPSQGRSRASASHSLESARVKLCVVCRLRRHFCMQRRRQECWEARMGSADTPSDGGYPPNPNTPSRFGPAFLPIPCVPPQRSGIFRREKRELVCAIIWRLEDADSRGGGRVELAAMRSGLRATSGR